MHPMFDIQAAKSLIHMFESVHAYPSKCGKGWNLYLRFPDQELDHDDSESGVLVKSRTVEPRLFIKLEAVKDVVDSLGFIAFEVHFDAV